MNYSEKWGVDVDEAVKLALTDLKLSREEVEVTVLEEPSKGFFGIGSKLAKVRVEKKKAEKPEKKAEGTFEKKTEEKPRPQKKEKREKRENREKKIAEVVEDREAKENLKEVEDHQALTFLREITDKMGLSLSFKAKVGEEIIYLEMDGKDSGTVIGKRGQTLDAIQYLTSLVVNKDREKYMKVVVDAENYRAKRQRTLEQLAGRLAAKVEKTRKYVRLEPMNPYERKVIHATLQQNPNVTTRSEGEEPYRRVVIELKK
ncbi:MAG: protein jag [Clostridiales bacterium]|nr:protein jag [Clostridiales bacterium]